MFSLYQYKPRDADGNQRVCYAGNYRRREKKASGYRDFKSLKDKLWKPTHEVLWFPPKKPTTV